MILRIKITKRKNTLLQRLNFHKGTKHSETDEPNNAMKNALELIRNRTDYVKERISEHKDKKIRMNKVANRELKFLKSEEILQELYDSARKSNIKIMGIPKREMREDKAESAFKEIMTENFPSLGKELDI